jgi:hypothetical protein
LSAFAFLLPNRLGITGPKRAVLRGIYVTRGHNVESAIVSALSLFVAEISFVCLDGPGDGGPPLVATPDAPHEVMPARVAALGGGNA